MWSEYNFKTATVPCWDFIAHIFQVGCGKCCAQRWCWGCSSTGRTTADHVHAGHQLQGNRKAFQEVVGRYWNDSFKLRRWMHTVFFYLSQKKKEALSSGVLMRRRWASAKKIKVCDDVTFLLTSITDASCWFQISTTDSMSRKLSTCCCLIWASQVFH